MDPDWIRIGIQPKMLNPDPHQMNADPQPWSQVKIMLGEAQIGRMSPQVEFGNTKQWG